MSTAFGLDEFKRITHSLQVGLFVIIIIKILLTEISHSVGSWKSCFAPYLTCPKGKTRRLLCIGI